MSETIMPAFIAFPDHAGAIGRMLAGYGELEFEFALCLAAALGDQATALRTFFRIKGEDFRIQIASALMRPKYDSAGLHNIYNEMLGAMRWCKATRNQFAHCHWAYDVDDGLYFTTFDQAVKTETGEIMLDVQHVSFEILKEQEAYFSYTQRHLWYLHHEYKLRIGELTSHPFQVPKTKPQPPRQSPPGTYTPPRISLAKRSVEEEP